MGQSGPGHSPDVGRPRGAVWRTLVSEGIAWEGQVTIAGEQSDLDARLIVTSQRLVFVRNGAIALDAQREWLNPAPTMGRNGRVSLPISTPNGSGPIPIEIRVRDGKFGAARLLARLDEGPADTSAPVSRPPCPASRATATGSHELRSGHRRGTIRHITGNVAVAAPQQPPGPASGSARRGGSLVRHPGVRRSLDATGDAILRGDGAILRIRPSE